MRVMWRAHAIYEAFQIGQKGVSDRRAYSHAQARGCDRMREARTVGSDVTGQVETIGGGERRGRVLGRGSARRGGVGLG